jgi:alpha-glucosidase
LTNTSTSYPNSDDRPFILTRSTFAGSGKYTSHWLGDNWREWRYMNYSIAGIMNMNMFGIPHSGADVCGFFGEKRDDEMCARWI